MSKERFNAYFLIKNSEKIILSIKKIYIFLSISILKKIGKIIKKIFKIIYSLLSCCEFPPYVGQSEFANLQCVFNAYNFPCKPGKYPKRAT